MRGGGHSLSATSDTVSSAEASAARASAASAVSAFSSSSLSTRRIMTNLSIREMTTQLMSEPSILLMVLPASVPMAGQIASPSTPASTVEYLESVSLDVRHTFYRTKTSSKGAGYQNQLDTVYFAVPKRFFDTYGRLQRIKAEWYEYKTKDIVVTSNQDFYNQAAAYVGKYMGYNRDSSVLSLGQQAGDGGGMMVAKWGWNFGDYCLHPACETLYYLFKVNDISEYDPYADKVSIGGVESNALYEYIKNHDKTFDGGTLPIKDGTISADLFESDIDDYRKLDTGYGKIQQGYSYYDFDSDVDLQKLSSWQEGNPSFGDNWMNWGLWDTIFSKIVEMPNSRSF